MEIPNTFMLLYCKFMLQMFVVNRLVCCDKATFDRINNKQ